MIKSSLIFIFIVLWSLSVLAFFHKGAFDESLRHTRVAEGNISKAVHHIWAKGILGYADILHSDAKNWGRIRPVHWLYYQIPFLLTMARNGDLIDSGTIALKDRMNGDLQTHVFFLLGSLAVVAGLMIWTGSRAGGPLWLLLLFPVYFACSETIHENLLVFYADSQEIPQLLFIGLYFASIRKLFSGSVPDRKHEIFASVFLLLAYGTKETTVVLFPVMGLFLLFHIFFYKYKESGFRAFCIRHLIVHFLFSAILLTLVFYYRSGSYVSDNYVYDLGFKEQLEYLINTFSKGLPVLRMMLVGGLTAVGLFILHYIFIGNENTVSRESKNLIFGATVFMGLSLLFWMINIPWKVKLIKYFLPVHFFAALAVVLVQIIVYKQLVQKKIYFGAAFWVIGTSIFMLKDSHAALNRMNQIYDNYYEYRESVPIVSNDITSAFSGEKETKKIYIASNYNFQEGALPFLRQVNQKHLLNISGEKGNVVNHIKAPEKNYFKIYDERPSVHISFSEELPENLISDVVYLIYDRMPESMQKKLLTKGFVRNQKWTTKKKKTQIEKYLKTVN